MIDGLSPYSELKESGVPWLARIPEHWQLQRLKTLLRERVEKGFPEEPLLAATQAKGVVRKDQYESRTVEAQKDFHLLKLVKRGDFVISLRSFQGGIEYARQRGIISPAYTVLYPRFDGTHSYLAVLFKSRPFVESLSIFVTGIRQGQNIDYEKLGRSLLPLPPADEQSAISRYLDHADLRIRRYIGAKQMLIKLLEEQKQAIIHRAVTRGLDPNVRLKPSGVEVWGDVPEHWEVLPVRRRWTVTDCKHLTVPFVDEGIPLASVREAQSFELRLDKARRTTEQWYEVLTGGDRVPRRGDLIYCRNVGVGAAALVETDDRFAMGQDVCLIRSSTQNQRFLNYVLHSPTMARQLARLMVGSTFDRINVAEIKSLLVVVPPRQEQESIARYLDDALMGANQAIDRLTREMALLREYRTRLIADVVTGQLDVREAATRLPDEAKGQETADEADILPDFDEAGTDDLDIVAEEDET